MEQPLTHIYALLDVAVVLALASRGSGARAAATFAAVSARELARHILGLYVMLNQSTFPLIYLRKGA